MSGHSKWSTIKRKKGALDSKRSKIFTKIVKEIEIAVKEGGVDINTNPRLRLAVANAKGVNMPKDNIARAISKGDKDPSNFTEMTFEGFAQGGVSVFVECLSDNSNRTVSNIRSVFNKSGGSLATNGSHKFLFERKSTFTILSTNIKNKDEFELEMIDLGAEDIEEQEENVIITAKMESFGLIQKKLEAMNIEVENAQLVRIANNYKNLEINVAKKVLRLVDNLEDDDDVQNVYHNLEITEELENEL